MNEKRLFFAFELEAVWPEEFPEGKVIKEENRHMTLLFLGKALEDQIGNLTSSFPKPSFKIGPVGIFDEVIFLPKDSPKVVCYVTKFLEKENEVLAYANEVTNWGKERKIDSHEIFLPHVTIARSPKELSSWKDSFEKLPFMVTKVALYESLQNSEYKSLWEHSFIRPIEELEHTADIAYKIIGENIDALFMHAKLALCFSCKEMIPYLSYAQDVTSTDDIVMKLNEMVTKADRDIGCPFKAISFHGKEKKENGLIIWEMVIDV